MIYFLYTLAILAGLFVYTLLYEIIRYAFLKKLKDVEEISKFVSRHQINIDRYKFTHKYLIKDDLLNDQEIHQEILKHAKEHDQRLELVREKVGTYIDEIVPFFNILSFYKIGYRIAKFSLNLMYDVVLDQKELDRLKTLETKDKVYIYIMNHRSNVDFVLAAYMLAKNICISFATGEWARVWPLEHLFKSFGSYFVRRGYPEPLYHKVLERYLQLVTLNGMTQGIFIEGGLSRDGLFRDPKIGLLSNIANIHKDPHFQKEIIIVPAGINFDRVLEDTHLLAEKQRKEDPRRRSFLWKIQSLFRLLGKACLSIPLNSFRILLKKWNRNGYATASFGEPLSLTQFIRKNPQYFQHSREEQKEILLQFGHHILNRIKEIIPIPPVALVSYALLKLEKDSFEEAEIVRQIMETRRELLGIGAKVVMGREFEQHRKTSQQLEKEKEMLRGELHDFEKEMLAADESKQTLQQAYNILKRRKILRRNGNVFFLTPDKKFILEYYANSIRHFFDKTWVQNLQKDRQTRISYYK
jgi:glycerol-3-phosphate O-acyltransferase